MTLEANPDSVDPASLARLREVGFTRISFGMQSAVPHVLAVLDRTHTPGGALRAVAGARAAGFEQVSLDLIYGTPGESLADWQATVDAALSAQVGHISAYALIVEPGTRLAAAVRRGTDRGTRRRPHGRHVRPRRRGVRGCRAALVRAVELGRAGPGVPAQPRLLARRRLVGGRARARTATWPGPGGGTSSTRRPTSSGSGPASPRLSVGRSSTTTPARSRRSSWACGWPTGLRVDDLTSGAAGRARGAGRPMGSGPWRVVGSG